LGPVSHAEFGHGPADVGAHGGQAETGRVITAASLIMILVFGAFILTGQLQIMEVGIGMAAAIFLDAYVIRTVFVPAAMHMLGRANWWLPALLDRLLPRLHVEHAELTSTAPLRQPTGGLVLDLALVTAVPWA